MANVIVTGGAGFIGSNLVRRLVEARHRVKVIDSMTYASNPKALDDLKTIGLDEANICDTATMYRTIRNFKPEIVYHLAAESHVDNSITESTVFLETNIMGTYSMLEACRKYFNELPKRMQAGFRFVHVSTDEVYGDLPLGRGKFTENTQYAPSSPYSASKAASDHLVHAWHRTYGLPTIITHCTNNYGPWQHKEKLIPTVIRKILDWEEIPVYGDGLNERDWIHVQDHCSGLIEAARNGEPGEVYNFGGDEVLRNIEVVHMICDHFKQYKKENVYDLVQYVKDRPGHDRRYAMDISRTKKLLDWAPKHKFDENIGPVIEWYINEYSNSK
jgi:dTDP-glucose 4,6-dehydratase